MHLPAGRKKRLFGMSVLLSCAFLSIVYVVLNIEYHNVTRIWSLNSGNIFFNSSIKNRINTSLHDVRKRISPLLDSKNRFHVSSDMRTSIPYSLDSKNRFLPRRDVIKINCAGLIQMGESNKTKLNNTIATKHEPFLTNSYFINASKNCDDFISKRGYIMDSMTSEEKHFPISFGIIIHKDVSHFERILRAIYRPQNYYCVHVDSKSSIEFKRAVASIISCFENVFMPERVLNVQWGTFSLLEVELVCMQALWRYSWKYYINLCGQEFPLKTNYEIVKILKALNGANSVEWTLNKQFHFRWNKAGTAPHKIKPVKGSKYIVACRGFVDYILHNQTAKDLLQWVKPTFIPDELYFSSLNYSPHLRIPGAFAGNIHNSTETGPAVAKFVMWTNTGWNCGGKMVRWMCVFGLSDLPLLVTQKHLFVNKFNLKIQPYALDCLEEWLYNKTREEYLGLTEFNNSYYKTLDFVVNKI